MEITDTPTSELESGRQYRAGVALVGNAWTLRARAPISAPSMRRSNAMHVLDALRRSGKATRVDLARQTGLTMPTIHRVMTALENAGLVCQNEGPPLSAGSGRPPAWYALKPTIATAVGIDIGNETTRMALALADGTIVRSTSVPTADIAAHLADELVRLINGLQAGVTENGRLVGVGIGISGTVNPTTGKIGRAAQYHEWDSLPLRDLLQAALECPVVVEQDDHLSALAELSKYGGTNTAPTLVVINAGKGIGVGVIAEGRMLRGAHGSAGRLAYWPLHGQGSNPVVAGNTLVTDALSHLYAAHGGARPFANGLDLCNAAHAGDPVAREIVATVGEALGDIFLRLAAVFDPEIMVFGGGLANSFDLFEPAITAALAMLPTPVSVVASRLGSAAVVLGALIAVGQDMERWLEEQFSLES